jgi:hypothetical protein
MRYVQTISLAGWTVDSPRYEVSNQAYRTNWGFPGKPDQTQSSYSRFRVIVPIRHTGSTSFLKTFLALFISLLIAGLAYFTHPEQFDGRIGMGIAGVFGAVTSQMLVSDRLPEIHYLTLSDWIHTLGLAYVFVSIFASCLAEWFTRKGREALAIRLDRILGAATTLAYAATVVTATMAT